MTDLTDLIRSIAIDQARLLAAQVSLHNAHVRAWLDYDEPQHVHDWVRGKDASGRYDHWYCECGADSPE
jgi:hypothetical protein